jgi:hypothetical protein
MVVVDVIVGSPVVLPAVVAQVEAVAVRPPGLEHHGDGERTVGLGLEGGGLGRLVIELSGQRGAVHPVEAAHPEQHPAPASAVARLVGIAPSRDPGRGVPQSDSRQTCGATRSWQSPTVHPRHGRQACWTRRGRARGRVVRKLCVARESSPIRAFRPAGHEYLVDGEASSESAVTSPRSRAGWTSRRPGSGSHPPSHLLGDGGCVQRDSVRARSLMSRRSGRRRASVLQVECQRHPGLPPDEMLR